MFKKLKSLFLNQKGAVEFAVVPAIAILVLLVGVGTGVYLVQQRTNLRSDATAAPVTANIVPSNDQTVPLNTQMTITVTANNASGTTNVGRTGTETVSNIWYKTPGGSAALLRAANCPGSDACVAQYLNFNLGFVGTWTFWAAGSVSNGTSTSGACMAAPTPFLPASTGDCGATDIVNITVTGAASPSPTSGAPGFVNTLNFGTPTCGANQNATLPISWTGVGNTTSYNLYRDGDGPGSANTTRIASGLTQASYTDTVRGDGSAHPYWVEAVGSGGTTIGEGKWTSAITCAPPTAANNPPTGSIRFSPTTITAGTPISITVDGADQNSDLDGLEIGYRLSNSPDPTAYNRLSNLTGGARQTCSGASCTYTFSNWTPGAGSYVMIVNAYDKAGNSCSGSPTTLGAYRDCGNFDNAVLTVNTAAGGAPSPSPATANNSPRGSIRFSPTTITAGTPIDITVDGTDANNNLSEIEIGYRFANDPNRTAYARLSDLAGGGRKTCSGGSCTYTFSNWTPGAGSYVMIINAYDSNGNSCSGSPDPVGSYADCGNSDNAVLTVNPSSTGLAPVITGFQAVNANITSGSRATLGWYVANNPTTCWMADDSGWTTNPGVASPGNIQTPVYTGNRTATITLACSNAAGATNATTIVNVSAGSTLSVSCSPGATQVAVGNPVSWGATVSGGSGNYSYQWISSSTELNNRTENPASISYSTTGTKSAQVRVTDSGTGQTSTQPCTASVTVGLEACGGFRRDCDNGNGTQWCEPGVYNAQRQCVADPAGSSTCYYSQTNRTIGCLPKVSTGVCSDFAPNGLINTQQLTTTGQVGLQIFKTAESRNSQPESNGIYLVRLDVTKNPSTAVTNRPTYTKSAGAPDLEFTDSNGVWLMSIPPNDSLVVQNEYVINATVTPPVGETVQTGNCRAFVVRVPRAVADTSCPTEIQSTQVRFRNSSANRWESARTIESGESVQIGVFHNNRTEELDGDTVITVTGPEGSASSSTIDLWPNAEGSVDQVFFSPDPDLPGRYTVRAVVKDKDIANGKCVGSSVVTVEAKPVVTLNYKIASESALLANAEETPYLNEPEKKDWTLYNTTPGASNFVWVEFENSEGDTERRNIEIVYAGPDPTIDQDLACSIGLDSNSISINVKGTNLGVTRGRMTLDGTNAQILDWKNDAVSGVANVPASLDVNKQYQIVVTRADGMTVASACRIGVSQLSLGTKIFCQAQNNQNVAGLKLAIQEASGGAVVSQNITVDKNGVVQNLTTKLQAGKAYKVSVESPKTLRRVATFTAGQGTSTLSNFNLPLGDIFPLNTGDGVINTADKAQLNRDWLSGPGTATAVRAGDFNSDGKVNTLDWACMKIDFGKSSDPALVGGRSGGVATSSANQSGQ